MLTEDLDMDEVTSSAESGLSESPKIAPTIIEPITEPTVVKRTISVTFFGYLGFLVLGVYTLIKAIEELPKTSLSTVLWVIFGLTYLVLSCYLLKLRNWARITLLVLNSVIAVFITLLDLFVFIWIPLTRGMGQSTEVLARTFKNSFFSFTTPDIFAFLITHFYFYGFLLLFTRYAIKGQYGYSNFTDPATANQGTSKRKMWPAIAIFSMGIAVCSGVLVFAGSTGPDISAINIITNPEQDALSCSLVVLRNIKLYSPHKDELLSRIAIAYAQTGGYEQAIQFVNVLEKDIDKAEVLVEIASSYVKTGEKQKACEVLSQALQKTEMIENDFIKSQKMKLIAIKYTEAGELNRAIEIAYKIKHACYKADVLAATASSYHDAGQTDKGSDFLYKAFETAKQENNAAIKQANLADIAIKYAQMDQYDHALQVAETITSTALKAEALGGIAANIKSEERKKANYVLAQALEEAAKIEDATFKATSTANIAVKFAEAGQYNRALQIAHPIEKVNARVDALARIALLYAQAGYREKAFGILLQASSAAVTAEDDLTVLTLGTRIASNYIEIGQKDRASFILSKVLPLAYEIRSENLKSSMLTVIVEKYAKAGKYVQALQIGRDLNVPTFKANSLVSIIIEYARAEQRAGGFDSKILHQIMQASE